MSPGAAWAFGFILGFIVAFCGALVVFTELVAPEDKGDKPQDGPSAAASVRELYVPQATGVARQIFFAGYRAGFPEATPPVAHEAISTHSRQIDTCAAAIAYELAQAYADGIGQVCAALQERSGLEQEVLREAMAVAIENARERHVWRVRRESAR